MNDFVGADKVAKFYSDNAGELQEAAKWLGWPRAKVVPGDHQSTWLAERFVGIVKNGARTLISQSGLAPSWWTHAIQCYCFCRNTEGGQKSAYYLRHNVLADSLRIPFGALVDFFPTPDAKPTFERKVRPGIFLGYFM